MPEEEKKESSAIRAVKKIAIYAGWIFIVLLIMRYCANEAVSIEGKHGFWDPLRILVTNVISKI